MPTQAEAGIALLREAKRLKEAGRRVIIETFTYYCWSHNEARPMNILREAYQADLPDLIEQGIKPSFDEWYEVMKDQAHDAGMVVLQFLSSDRFGHPGVSGCCDAGHQAHFTGDRADEPDEWEFRGCPEPKTYESARPGQSYGDPVWLP